MIKRKGRLASTIALAAVLVLIVSACGKKDEGGASSTDAKADEDVSGKITISGSSTVEPITAAVREAFIGQNDKVDISVDGPGTGDGFKLFCDGKTDISDASRPIKAEEADACKAKGIEFIELKVAIDGLTVITAEDNPLECLSFADLYALTGPESRGFKKWTDAADLAKELESDTEFPDENLVITAPGEESGTYDSFIEIALEDTGTKRFEDGKLKSEDDAGTTRPDYSASADDNTIIEGVSGDPGGFGWVGFSFADQAEGVKLMPISEEPGGDCVEPSAETIQDGSYPIARDLYIYVDAKKAKSNKALSAFVDFYVEGLDAFAEGADYIALNDDAETVKTWEDKTTGTREAE